MARARSPDRIKAEEIYLKHKGNIELVKIAEILDRPPGTIRGWKNKDSWDDKLNGTLQKKNTERSKRKKGGQPGNKNAVGNKGGAAPPGNKNAVTTGEFETIFFDTLEPDEIGLIQYTIIEKKKLLEHEIQLLTVRERRMMKRIAALKETGDYTVVKTKIGIERGEQTDLTESENVLEQIQTIEEALTRVQDKKQKAIDSLHKYEIDEEKLQIQKEKLELEKLKVKGPEEDDQNAIDDFIKATSPSKRKLNSLFEDDINEKV